MKNRKKTKIDGIDKEILRVLYLRRPMVSRQIACSVGLSSSAIFPRLEQLRNNGLIKISKISKVRIFERTFNGHIQQIKSPRSIHWDLDLEV
jgi:DNA-binding transcriptional regulator LsrR (DeoR family)